MLSEGSYLLAMLVYLLAGCLALLAVGWWLRSRPVLAFWLMFCGAALLLTPAYPESGTATMAPALIVAVFQTATSGIEAAMHALRPLAAALGLAQILSLLAWLLVRRRRVAVAPAS